MEQRKQIFLIVAAFVTVLVLDQVTKAIIVATIPVESVWPPGWRDAFFCLTHRRNTGLVGGAFRDMPLVVYVAPVLASFVLIYLYRHLDRHSRLHAIAYGMVVGGAVGNIADRIRLGSVTDFLQFYFHFVPFDFPWKHYPAFNVADSAICVGVALLILGWHLADRRARHTEEAPDAADAG